MSNRAIVILKFVVFPACLIPFCVLVYQGFTNTLGPDPVATITHTTGFWTLYFLLISLAITPIRRLSGRLVWLIRFRRMLGLFAFFYGTLHLMTWVWLYSNFDVHAMLHDIGKRPFITVGMTGWSLPAAVGSNLHRVVDSQAGRQALDCAAPAGVCCSDRGSHSLLVAGKTGRAYSLESDRNSRRAAAGACRMAGEGSGAQAESRSRGLTLLFHVRLRLGPLGDFFRAEFCDAGNQFDGNGLRNWKANGRFVDLVLF